MSEQKQPDRKTTSEDAENKGAQMGDNAAPDAEAVAAQRKGHAGGAHDKNG